MNREELFENRWAVWAGDGTTLHLVHRSGMPRALCGAVTMQDEYIGPRLIETADPRPLYEYASGSPVCSPCTDKALHTMRKVIDSQQRQIRHARDDRNGVAELYRGALEKIEELADHLTVVESALRSIRGDVP